MKYFGLDLALGTDLAAVVEMEVQGSHKAPHPHDVVYVLKDWKYLHLADVGNGSYE